MQCVIQKFLQWTWTLKAGEQKQDDSPMTPRAALTITQCHCTGHKQNSHRFFPPPNWCNTKINQVLCEICLWLNVTKKFPAKQKWWTLLEMATKAWGNTTFLGKVTKSDKNYQCKYFCYHSSPSKKLQHQNSLTIVEVTKGQKPWKSNLKFKYNS
jgi:hypothetical protein